MITFHKASLETRNFDFEAYGGTASEARTSLQDGLCRHARTYKIPVTWWREFEDDIKIIKVTLGACYRGPEII